MRRTAGYGNTYPNECWAAAWLIMVQSVLGMIMDAITIGIVFARISHPKQRGRTIAISDSAVISRRDGILKFMFRIADIRRTQVWHLPGVKDMTVPTLAPYQHYAYALRSSLGLVTVINTYRNSCIVVACNVTEHALLCLAPQSPCSPNSRLTVAELLVGRVSLAFGFVCR